MSTHMARCMTCRKKVYCCNDEMVYGLTGCTEFGIYKRAITFCSQACVEELYNDLTERIAFVKKEFPEMWNEAPLQPQPSMGDNIKNAGADKEGK